MEHEQQQQLFRQKLAAIEKTIRDTQSVLDLLNRKRFKLLSKLDDQPEDPEISRRKALQQYFNRHGEPLPYNPSSF